MDPFSAVLGIISAIVGAGVSAATKPKAPKPPEPPKPEFLAPERKSLSGVSGGLRDPGSTSTVGIDPNSVQLQALRELRTGRVS